MALSAISKNHEKSLMFLVRAILRKLSVNSYVMKKWIYKIWAKFLTWFGNIKIFKFPLFVVYDPSDYAMDGKHVKVALDVL